MSTQASVVYCAPEIVISWDEEITGAQPELHMAGSSPIPLKDTWFWSAGYIANRAELIGQLSLKTHRDDRELLTILYRQFGENAANLIAGAFAWIVWDSHRQELIAARDRSGNYNFYYTILDQRLWVANRLEALLKLELLPRRPNIRSVVAQITGNAPLPGETFYENIQELEPGGWLHARPGRVQTGRYWQIQPLPLLRLSSDGEYADALRALLFRVVSEHTPPEKVSVTLSSGLDSTSVAAAICHAAPHARLGAISWVAPDLPEADEGRITAEIGRFLGIPQDRVRADLIWPMKNPQGIRTSAITPFYNFYTELWEETFRASLQQGATVLFSGMSGDHLFGGGDYAYPDLLLAGRWVEMAHQIRAHQSHSPHKRTLFQFVIATILSPLRRAYLPGWRRSSDQPVPWLQPPYDQLYWEHFGRPAKVHPILPGRLLRLRTLADPLLPRIVENMNLLAEGHGVQFRHPLLDHRLVEFAAGLPTSQTFYAGQRKIIVRNAMRGLLPPEVLAMWGKIYPSAIGHRGLREQEQLKVWPLLRNMRLSDLGYVDEQKLQQTYQNYLDGKTGNAVFWHTITLEDWLRRWF